MSDSWQHDDSDYITAVKQNQPAGTGDIADVLGVTLQSSAYRLKKLEKEGKVTSQKIGGSLVWTIED